MSVSNALTKSRRMGARNVADTPFKFKKKKSQNKSNEKEQCTILCLEIIIRLKPLKLLKLITKIVGITTISLTRDRLQ